MIENINAQLSSSQIVDVLTALEDAGSSYARSFHAIKKEIYKARLFYHYTIIQYLKICNIIFQAIFGSNYFVFQFICK